ncbi:MAG: acyltransferase [Lachnospiraceae bacterium]|nr:acyltransferase [Lachnospiraceae bacterium]
MKKNRSSLSSERVFFSKNVTLAAKGIGAILMLNHHLFSCFPEYVDQYQVSSRLFSMDTVMRFSIFSKICVAIFVVLSAYGMTLSFDRSRGSGTQYVKRRLFRLEAGFWPVFFLATATFFLREDHLGVYLASGKGNGLLYYVIDGLGLASFLGTPTYNETWWYMSLAILMVFLVPVLVKLYDAAGICVLGLLVMAPYLGVAMTPSVMYLCSIAIGIWLARGNLLDRVQAITATGVGKGVFLVGMLAVLLALYRYRDPLAAAWLSDGAAALVIILILFVLVDEMKLPLPVLRWIGKHSMNVFLIHTLLLEYYFRDVVYRGKNWFLILLVLLVMSLTASVLVEMLKQAGAVLVNRIKRKPVQKEEK